MKVFAADTSFLFSLYGKDAWTVDARDLTMEIKSPIQISSFNTLELTNAAFHAEFSGHLGEGLGEVIVSRYKSEVELGRLVYSPFNPTKAIERAVGLTNKYTLTQGHRTYDVLLVAAAIELGATDFLTFDGRQAKLAKAEGLMVWPLK